MPDLKQTARVMLLTGAPGVGKTTVMRSIAEHLSGWKLGGFTTEEIRERGHRVGFCGRTMEGRVLLIAHAELTGPPRVGRYGVDVKAIDELAKSIAPSQWVRAYLIDEIGTMECHSQAFIAAVRKLLAMPIRIVATIGARGGGFMAEVRAHAGSQLWEVTPGSRDALPEQVVAWLQSPHR
jgi:nucleoside-triphosphatase